jgi:hypothetical protein
MKLAITALIAAVSLAGAVAPASAEAARQEVRPDTLLKTQYHRPFHHRHRVCVMRHHRRICSWR